MINELFERELRNTSLNGVSLADYINENYIVKKTGHWILADEQNKEEVENDNYRFICSECQCSDLHAKGTIVPYCWKCGARMFEPQEGARENDIFITDRQVQNDFL